MFEQHEIKLNGQFTLRLVLLKKFNQFNLQFVSHSSILFLRNVFVSQENLKSSFILISKGPEQLKLSCNYIYIMNPLLSLLYY